MMLWHSLPNRKGQKEPPTRRFLRPANPAHRQCWALCARFVGNLSLHVATERFGCRIGTFRNLCTAFRKDPGRAFFETPKPGPG